MKKLKALLVLLFSLVMSLALFACGGDGEEEQPGGENPGGQQGGETPGGDKTPTDVPAIDDLKDEVDGLDDLALTDSDTLEDWEDAIAEITMVYYDENGVDYTIEKKDITVENAPVVEEGKTTLKVGTYSVRFVPFKGTTANDPDNNNGKEWAVVVSVKVSHDWDHATGSATCVSCKAVRSLQEENAIIHYGTFHEGTLATLPASYTDTDGQVWKNNAQGNTVLSDFGASLTPSGMKQVPTITAGQLQKGMTITLRGTTKTATGDDSPWIVDGKPKTNEQWNFPVIGIADRNYDAHMDEAYTGGAAVLVRGEGWVLYDGIGCGNDLAENRALASLAGGAKAKGNENWRNFGTFQDDTPKVDSPVPEGYVQVRSEDELPEAGTDAWDDWKDFWVHSFGVQTQSGKALYTAGTDIEVSWYYRNDGVIEMRYVLAYKTNPRELVTYIKVPDSSTGYYDTILHGDYSDMTVTESEVISTLTPEALTINGVEDAGKLYLEGQMIDATTIVAKMKYEQKDTPENFTLSAGQIFAYTGGGGKAEAQAALTDSTKWKSLANEPLHPTYKFFKAEVTTGADKVRAFIDADIKIVPTGFEDAIGFENGGEFVLTNTADDITLTLQNYTVAAAALDEGSGYTKIGTADVSGARYLVLRLNGYAWAEWAASGFDFSEVEVSGAAALFYKTAGSDIYLAIALTSTQAQSGDITISGLQATPIKVKLDGKLVGYNVGLTVTKNESALNDDGEVTFEITGLDDNFALVLSGLNITSPRTVQKSNLDSYKSDKDKGRNPNVTTGVYYVSHTFENGTLTLTVNLSKPTNLANYKPLTVQVQNGDAVEYVQTVWHNVEFVSTDKINPAGNEGMLIEANGTTLTIAVAIQKENLAEGDITVESGALLNFNNGDVESLRLVDIGATYQKGKMVLLQSAEGVSVSCILFGTFDGQENDAGAYILYTIDMTKFGISAATDTLYFEAVGQQEENGNVVYYSVTNGAVEKKTFATSGATLAYVSEGDCWHAGYSAYEVKDGDTVLFLAGVTEIAGDHVDKVGGTEGGPDGICDLCGGTMTEERLPDWADPFDSLKKTLRDGQRLDVTGDFASEVADVGGNYGPFLAILANNGEGGTARYWLRTDGWVVKHPKDNWDNAITCGPGNVEKNGTADVDPNFYTSLGANTLTGVLLPDGRGLGTDITFSEFFANKKYHFVVTYLHGTVKVEYYYYDENNTLVLSYNIEIRNLTGNVNVSLIADEPAYANGNAKIVTGSEIDPSALTAAEALTAAFNGKAASADLTFANNKNVVTLGGNATKDGAKYYTSFALKLNKSLPDPTYVSILDASGAVLKDSKVEINAERNEVKVFISIDPAVGLAQAVVHFSNFTGKIEQGDVIIDLRSVIVSELTAALSENTLNAIDGGSVKITYTGTVEDTYTLVCGTSTLAVSALEKDAKLGAFTVESVDKTNGLVVVLKLGKADLESAIATHTIEMRSGDSLLISTVITYNSVTVGGTEIESSGAHVYAVGGKLYLVWSDETATGHEFTLNVNAGKKTDGNLLGNFVISFSDAGAFTESNALTRTGKIVVSKVGDTYLTVVVLDLSAFGVEESTAYGYEQVQEGSTKYYLVSADRKITEATKASGESESIVEGGCTENGVSGKKAEGEVFYYGLAVVNATGHQWTLKENASTEDLKGYDALYECSNECGSLKYVQNSSTQTWGVGTGTNWFGNSWVTYGSVVKGGSYTVTGTNDSAENQIWNLPEPGITDEAGGDADGFRLDHYVQGDNGTFGYITGQPTDNVGLTFEVYDNKTNAATTFDTVNASDAVKKALDKATITFTFDYTDPTKLVLTVHFVSEDETIDFSEIWTITDTAALNAEVVYLAFHADENVFHATGAETVVPEGAEPAAALSKHVHDFDNDNDRCPDDQVLNPNHGDTENGGKAHKYDATHHCEICGILDPAHTTHNYEKAADKQSEGVVYCVCGALNPEHEHVNENGACTLCGKVSLEGLTEAGFTAVTFTQQNVVNFQSRLYEVPVGFSAENGLTVGKKLVVVGSLTSTMYQNWFSVYAEVLCGYTMRSDNAGWTFDPDADSGDGVTAFGNATMLTHIYNSAKELAEGDDIWTTFKDMGKTADWKVEFDYKSAAELVITITVSGTNGLSLITTQTLPIVNAAMIERFPTIWVGIEGDADHASSLTVSGYKLF